MAEEPQPDSIHEGASAQPPLHAEDRKAAAALSSLETQNDDEESAPTKAVDTEALGKAMKNLDVKDKPALAKEPGKKVKVDAADVTLLVEQLELSRIKAAELLRAHEGDAVKAMTAYVVAPI